MLKELDPVEKLIQELSYLGDLSEEFIYHNFKALWPKSFNLPTTDLSLEENIWVLNMKVRSVNQNGIHSTQSVPLLPVEDSVRLHFEQLA